jgi:hypothetical protein
VWRVGELLTAPCAGYCRASAMWSEDSFAGRASRAVRNDLQKASSDMVDGLGLRSQPSMIVLRVSQMYVVDG